MGITGTGTVTDGHGGDPQERAEAIFTVIESIPRGRVLSYGDVAELAGVGSARIVGRLLAREGGDDLPWHRVVRADGSCAAHIRDRQVRLLRAEGVPMRGDRVDMRSARGNVGAL